MNYESLKRINAIKDINYYIDRAIVSAKEDSRHVHLKTRDKAKIQSSKNKALVSTFVSVMKHELNKIANSFPDPDELSDFYRMLIESKYELSDIKQAINHIKWVVKKLDDLKYNYRGKYNRYFSFLGRATSLVKDLKKEFDFLNELRLYFKTFPTIKDLPTIALIGFPNVGKSSFLKTFTTSNPKVRDYAFTTQKLQIGYVKDLYRLQIIDCPGMLNRAFEDMNWIEKLAYLALNFSANEVFFIFDPTQDYKEQIQLLNRVIKLKQVYVFVNKMDVVQDFKFESLFQYTKPEKIKKIYYISIKNKINLDQVMDLMQKIFFKVVREMRLKNKLKNNF